MWTCQTAVGDWCQILVDIYQWDTAVEGGAGKWMQWSRTVGRICADERKIESDIGRRSLQRRHPPRRWLAVVVAAAVVGCWATACVVRIDPSSAEARADRQRCPPRLARLRRRDAIVAAIE